MSEPTIMCPNCKTEIELTESLAAPLIESTRLEYQKQLVQKDAEVAKRDTELREREEALTKAQQTIDDQVAEKLRQERGKIAGRNSSLPRPRGKLQQKVSSQRALTVRRTVA